MGHGGDRLTVGRQEKAISPTGSTALPCILAAVLIAGSLAFPGPSPSCLVSSSCGHRDRPGTREATLGAGTQP
jgi:hypothetical protein